jgi:hypothetical protein
MDKHRNSSSYRIVTPSIVVFALLLVALGGIFVLDAKADGGGAVPTDTPEPTSTMTPITLELESESEPGPELATEVPTLEILPEATLDSTEEAFMAELNEAAPLAESPAPAEAASGGLSRTSLCLIGVIVISVVAVILLVFMRMRKAQAE